MHLIFYHLVHKEIQKGHKARFEVYVTQLCVRFVVIFSAPLPIQQTPIINRI
jgi:hypothetical protein